MDFVFVSDQDFPNLDLIPHTFNSCFFSAHLYQNHKIMEGFSELNWEYSSNQVCLNKFPDLENLDLDFSLPPLIGEDMEEVDQKPFNIVNVPQEFHCKQEKGFGETKSLVINENGSATASYVKMKEEGVQSPLPVASNSTKKRACALEFYEIKNHFGVPMNEAAKRLNVGITMLKRRCRELNIMRWPHRKLKSLQLLIDNVKEMGLADEVKWLEKHKRLMEKLPGLELSEEAKKLRQACFKANFNKRRFTPLPT